MKVNLFVRVFILVPCLIIALPMWIGIGLFSTERLGKVLKKTGENLLERTK